MDFPRGPSGCLGDRQDRHGGAYRLAYFAVLVRGFVVRHRTVSGNEWATVVTCRDATAGHGHQQIPRPLYQCRRLPRSGPINAYPPPPIPLKSPLVSSQQKNSSFFVAASVSWRFPPTAAWRSTPRLTWTWPLPWRLVARGAAAAAVVAVAAVADDADAQLSV